MLVQIAGMVPTSVRNRIRRFRGCGDCPESHLPRTLTGRLLTKSLAEMVVHQSGVDIAKMQGIPRTRKCFDD
jgi:hypothetical protein